MGTDYLTSLLVGAVLVAFAVFVFPRILGGSKIKCTRCDGSGQIDEHWPDPSKPSGIHTASGTCPKCKGKGRIKP